MPRSRARKLAVSLVGAGIVAAALASTAAGALFFLFSPTSAKPGDRVTVRLGGTPAGFTLADRVWPFQRPIRVYLVPNDDAAEVRTRFDPRLHFVGSIVPDRNARGLLEFAVPPLDSGTYAAAAWCPGCVRYSVGRAFSVLPIPRVSRYRRQMGLRVVLPVASDSCPVTIPTSRPAPGLAGSAWGPWHSNELLWTSLPENGVFSRGRRAADGSIWTKWIWFSSGVDGDLIVRLERLDESSPVVTAPTGRGSMEGFRGTATWAARTGFTGPGCWRVTGRVRDVTLSFVVRVVAEQ